MNYIRDFINWSPMEGQSKAPPPSTFMQRVFQFGRDVTKSMTAASSDVKERAGHFRDNAVIAAEHLRDNAVTAGHKIKDSVQDIHLRPAAVPKLASFLGLGFWWAPGVASTLLNCALITAFVQGLGWAIHSGTDIVAHHEAFGILNIVGLAMYSYAVQPALNLRQFLLTACVALWGLRLSAFLVDRFKDEGVDRTLSKVRTRRGRALLWGLQAFWVFITALPIMISNAETGKSTSWTYSNSFASLGLRDYIGFSLWILGFACESIADWEKAQFRKRPIQEGEKPFIDTGLWKYSRHPNYFGEILMWVGLYIVSSTVLHGWQQISILSPLLMSFILRFVTGVPRVEAQADRTFGANPSYQEYKKRTPIIVPFL